MRVSWVVIFSFSYFVLSHSLPAKQTGPDEVEFVPLEDQNGGPIIVDTGSWFGPFDGLFESLAGMMARMRQQMDYILKRIPFKNSTIADDPFPGFPDIDLDKANTTSVTKVIDGHKVVINETEYKQQGEHGGAFFKVRIIDVLPDSSELTTEKNAESITNPPKDPESVENSFENEIPKNTNIEDFSKIETFDEPDSFHPLDSTFQQSQKITDGSTNWASLEPIESFGDNAIETAFRPPDLSRDTYVNQIMADAGAPINPDAEVFSNMEFGTNPKQPFEKIINPR